MSIQTPNMSLYQPTIGVDSGLTWEQNLNANASIIDGHNHAAGSGVQINPSGININSDLSFNSSNAISLRSARFSAQSLPLALAADLGCLYVSGVDLYYNDENGNQIQITSGGSVNATSSGISSGTASASFSSSVLVVNAASNTPANVQGASFLFGNTGVSGSKYCTVAPPSALAANYNLTLPSLPASQKIMSLDNSGVISAPYGVDNTSIEISSNTIQVKDLGISTAKIADGSITTAKIADANVTRPKLVAVGQQISSSCGNYTTTSGSFVTITNLSVSITTTGRPVMMFLQSDASADGSGYYLFGNTSLPVFRFARGSTAVGIYELTDSAGSSRWPVSALMTLDTPAAGTYTYTAQVKLLAGGFQMVNTVLVVYEL